MRLVLFNDFTPGVLKGDNVVDVSGLLRIFRISTPRPGCVG